MLDELPVLPEEPSLAAGVLEDLSHLLNALAGGDLLEAGASKLRGGEREKNFLTIEVASPILCQNAFTFGRIVSSCIPIIDSPHLLRRSVPRLRPDLPLPPQVALRPNQQDGQLDAVLARLKKRH